MVDPVDYEWQKRVVDCYEPDDGSYPDDEDDFFEFDNDDRPTFVYPLWYLHAGDAFNPSIIGADYENIK